MLAITTDMQAPKDVNAVSITILKNKVPVYNDIARVTPEGNVLLPATLAIVEPKEQDAEIRIRVMAFKETKAVVLRDVRTTVPRDGRVALLRMPLEFVNTPSVDGAPPLPASELPPSQSQKALEDVGATDLSPLVVGTFPSDIFPTGCPVIDQTWIDGVCQDSFVDSSKLPDYVESDVFGPGGNRYTAVCFDVAKCFTTETEAKADAACQVDLAGADPASVNFAVANPQYGRCVKAGECYVPIDRGASGWDLQGGRAQLPAWACKLASNGNRIVMSTSACASKTESNPVCQSTEGDAPGETGLDGGTTAPVIDRIIDESFPFSVAIAGTRVMWAAQSRIGIRDMTNPSDPGGELGGIPASYAAWTLRAAGNAGILFANGGMNAWQLVPPSAPTVYGFDGGVTEGDVFGTSVAWVGGPSKLWVSQGQTSLQYSGNSSLLIVPRALVSLGATTSAVAVGGEDGQLQICTESGGCSSAFRVAPGPIERLVMLPPQGGNARGLALAQDGIYRIDQNGPGSIVAPAPKVVTADATPFTVGPPLAPNGQVEHRRSIDVQGSCAFVSTARGLEYTNLAQPGAPLETLYPAPAGTQVLGVAAGNISGVSAVYFAVHGPGGPGNGGIYRTSIPAVCAGGASGSDTDAGQGPSGKDAAAQPVDAAGSF